MLLVMRRHSFGLIGEALMHLKPSDIIGSEVELMGVDVDGVSSHQVCELNIVSHGER